MVANLIFGGVSAADYGAIVDGSKSYGAPERDVTITDVPGRNGSLLLDNGRYRDIDLQYSLKFRNSLRLEWYRSAMTVLCGYQRLEDERHPDEYRVARLTGTFTPNMSGFHNRRGTVDLTFTCKPQRFLKSGEREVAVTNGAALYNATAFPALPLIRVTGSGAGQLAINGCRVDFKETFSGPLWLDCDTQNAYWESANKNAQIYAPEFPVLESGENKVSWNGGVQTVTIIPRWWTL